jgi:hypothetical protein
MARKPTNRFKASSSIALAGWVLEGMRALECLASEGDKIAADFLVRIARQAASDLNEMVTNDSEPFGGAARQELTWPVLYSPQKFYRTDTKALAKALLIGEDFGLNLFGKSRSFDLRSPGNKLALTVINTISENRSPLRIHSQRPSGTESVPGWVAKCRSLEPFSKDSVNQWIEVGWEMIMQYTEGNPAGHEALSKIGKHRAGKGREGSKSEASHIQSGIKEKFSEAMKKLARPKLVGY